MGLKTRTALAVVALVVVMGSVTETLASDQWPLRRALNYNWNANYAHVQYGQPVAMVVPPTVQMQTQWSWGVGSSRVSRLDHQFGRNYPGAGRFGAPYQPQPVWPQDTAQFGVYNVRGPW